MSSVKSQTVEEAKPETIVVVENPSPPTPPLGDLVFTRDHSKKGLAYSANIEHWFRDDSQADPNVVNAPSHDGDSRPEND